MPDDAFADACDAAVPSPGRALVPLTRPSGPVAMPAPFRPDARFVVQLIATASHAPQTRALRRAAPSDAVTTYANVVGFVGGPTPVNIARARVA